MWFVMYGLLDIGFKLLAHVKNDSIFRFPAGLDNLKQAAKTLEHQVKSGGSLEFQSLPPRIIANLFKRYLRVMPEPVIAYSLYPLFLATLGKLDNTFLTHFTSHYQRFSI
jgi:hypothetical protein